MNINMYVINAILILMVIRQIREHPLDLRSLADVLTRLVIIYLRGRRLAGPAASAVRTPAGLGA